MEDIFQHCDFCNKPILTGQRYGTLVYNIETFNRDTKHPNGTIDVHHSEEVHIMCLACGERYNRENVEEEIKELVNQGYQPMQANKKTH